MGWLVIFRQTVGREDAGIVGAQATQDEPAPIRKGTPQDKLVRIGINHKDREVEQKGTIIQPPSQPEEPPRREMGLRSNKEPPCLAPAFRWPRGEANRKEIGNGREARVYQVLKEGNDWLRQHKIRFDPATLILDGEEIPLGEDNCERLPVVAQTDIRLPPRITITGEDKITVEGSPNDGLYHITPTDGYDNNEEVTVCSSLVKDHGPCF